MRLKIEGMKTYRVNDLFYSLQGEGFHTGRAAVFVRFAGCNLRCPFCDTDFDSFREMSADDILSAISHQTSAFIPQPSSLRPLVVLTGGEPTLQVDVGLVELLHQHGYYVTMESNGILPAPHNLDWLTVSPKTRAEKEERGEKSATSGGKKEADELKIVFDEHTDPEAFLMEGTGHTPPLLYLQPCDTGDPVRNAEILTRCIDYIKSHPQWRLSLQTHKLAGFK